MESRSFSGYSPSLAKTGNFFISLFNGSVWTYVLVIVICGFCSLDRVSCEERDEISVSGIDDVVMILMADYENAYFVTGDLKCT